jgi:hypothetical protein
MKLRMLSERAAMREHKRVTMGEQPVLRPVEELAPIISLPVTRAEPVNDPATPGTVTVAVDVRAKRFRERTVEDERYTATVVAQEGSPSGIVAALAEALAQYDDFRRVIAPGEHLILEVRLRA